MAKGALDDALLQDDDLQFDAVMEQPGRQETIRTLTKNTSKQQGPLLTPAITSPFAHRPGAAARPSTQATQAQQQRLRTQVALSCAIMFAEGFYATHFFPYGPWMTETLRGDTSDLGTYTGLFYTAQSFGMLTTAYFWAGVSNRYGRRFCLLLGLCSNLTATVLMAVSTDYWTSIALRLISGVMNSNLSIMRTALREFFQHEDAEDTWAFSTLSVAFGASSVAGPSYGGLVYGRVLPWLPECWQHPWSLALLTCTALYAVSLVVTAAFMPETAFLHRRMGATASGRAPSKSPSLLRDKCFVLLLVMGGGHSYVFTGWEIAYPLIARLPASSWGEHWTTAAIGLTFLVGSVGLMLYSLVIYPIVAKRLSVIRLWNLSAVPPLVAMAAFPRLLRLLADGGSSAHSQGTLALNYGTQVVVSMLMGSGFISIQLLLNNYVSGLPGAKGLLALANSLLVSTQAFVRAVSPMSTGALFTLGLQAEGGPSADLVSRALPFDSLAVVGLASCVLCGLAFQRRA